MKVKHILLNVLVQKLARRLLELKEFLQEINIKKVALGLYSVVIALVLFSMVYLLNNENTVTSDAAVVTDQIQIRVEAKDIEGIIAAVEGHSSVPIEDIDTILPLEPDKPAWQQHAAAWNGQSPYGRIAIVIDDVGLSYDISMSMADMVGPLTLSFLPYAERLPEQTNVLKNAGHELMVHMPMEPKLENADPGPNALLSSLAADEFERRILWNLGRFGGFVGINNHMGSYLTEQPGLMVRVMTHLRRGGYLFLDSLTSPKSVAGRAARATGVPTVSRDIFLDNERTMQAILSQLTRTEEIAKIKGYAIAIGHPYPETLKALNFWSANLADKGFILVPLSQIVAETEAAAGKSAQAR